MSIITIGVVGAKNSGKTQLCSRMVSHRFDPVHKETLVQTCFYARFQEKATDTVVCFEDTPPSEILSTEIFTQKFWFELDENYG